MKALLFENKVVETHEKGFPVAEPFIWEQVPDYVKAGDYWYSGSVWPFPASETIESLKVKKNESITSLRNSYLSGTYIFDNKEFQIDEKSRSNIIANLAAIPHMAPDAVIPWITADNSEYIFTQESFLTFYKKVSEYVSHLYFHARKLKDEVNALQDKLLIWNYTINEGWHI